MSPIPHANTRTSAVNFRPSVSRSVAKKHSSGVNLFSDPLDQGQLNTQNLTITPTRSSSQKSDSRLRSSKSRPGRNKFTDNALLVISSSDMSVNEGDPSPFANPKRRKTMDRVPSQQAPSLVYGDVINRTMKQTQSISGSTISGVSRTKTREQGYSRLLNSSRSTTQASDSAQSVSTTASTTKSQRSSGKPSPSEFR